MTELIFYILIIFVLICIKVELAGIREEISCIRRGIR